MFKSTRSSKSKRNARPVAFEKLEDRQLFNGGGLDTSFGHNGFTSPFIFQPSAVAVQADGKTVVVGSAVHQFFVGRVNTNGTVDTSFGFGLEHTSFGNGENAIASAVAIQPDGKIVVAGIETDSNGDRWAFARYNTNGSLDTTFGNKGIETVADYNDETSIVAVKALPNGKIIFAGSRDSGTFLGFGNGEDIYVGRLLSNGALDTTFGDSSGIFSSSRNGYATTDLGSQNDVASQLAIMPDGRIVVGAGEGNLTGSWAFARYSPAGALDSSFGNQGIVTTNLNSDGAPGGMAVTPDGQIYAAGQVGSGTRVVAHYFSNGQMDTHFGNGGLVTLSAGQTNSPPVAVFLPAPGKILVVSGSQDIQADQLNGNGSYDPTFGTNGKATISTLPATAGNAGAKANFFEPVSVAETGTGQLMLAAFTNPSNPLATLSRIVEETPTFSLTTRINLITSIGRYETITVSRDQAYDFSSRVNIDTITPPQTGNAGAFARVSVAGVTTGGVQQNGFYVTIPAGALSTSIHEFIPNSSSPTPTPTTGVNAS